MPLVSGAGIKNKLLEAAALGLPIICTPMSTRGLRAGAPLIARARPASFASALVQLWQNAPRQQELGAACRDWVLKTHVWTATARHAVASIEETLGGKQS
jgi:glycosyltransferase involved in cell wall biosynthesis